MSQNTKNMTLGTSSGHDDFKDFANNLFNTETNGKNQTGF